MIFSLCFYFLFNLILRKYVITNFRIPGPSHNKNTKFPYIIYSGNACRYIGNTVKFKAKKLFSLVFCKVFCKSRTVI